MVVGGGPDDDEDDDEVDEETGENQELRLERLRCTSPVQSSSPVESSW